MDAVGRQCAHYHTKPLITCENTTIRSAIPHYHFGTSEYLKIFEWLAVQMASSEESNQPLQISNNFQTLAFTF